MSSTSPKRETDPKKRIVITGMELVSVFGTDVDTYYNKLLDGDSGITLIDRFDTSDFAVKIAAQIRSLRRDTSTGRMIVVSTIAGDFIGQTKEEVGLNLVGKKKLQSERRIMAVELPREEKNKLKTHFKLKLKCKVNYVNAHATSTPAGDMTEVKAIKKVFNNTTHLKMNATKSMIGHALGAAGGLEAIAMIKAINTGWLHPTINQDELEGEVLIDTVPNVKQQHQVNVAISNSFGIGGHNSVVVFAPFSP